MKVYVVIYADRHTDVEVELFTERETAILAARTFAVDIMRDWRRTEEDLVNGSQDDEYPWEAYDDDSPLGIYMAAYGEGSDVWVVEKELDVAERDRLAEALQVARRWLSVYAAEDNWLGLDVGEAFAEIDTALVGGAQEGAKADG